MLPISDTAKKQSQIYICFYKNTKIIYPCWSEISLLWQKAKDNLYKKTKDNLSVLIWNILTSQKIIYPSWSEISLLPGAWHIYYQKDNLSILIRNTLITSWCVAAGCEACPTFPPFLQQAPSPAQSFYKQTEHFAELSFKFKFSNLTHFKILTQFSKKMQPPPPAQSFYKQTENVLHLIILHNWYFQYIFAQSFYKQTEHFAQCVASLRCILFILHYLL